jgi:GNAT superfamily N-acetyltransferase
MTLRLRPARPDEARALEGMQLRASLEWEDYREQLSANPGVVRLPDEHLALAEVAELDGRLAGFSVLLPPESAGGDAELDGLFVEPQAWGRGVGRALLEAAADRAGGLGAGGLHVVANPRAVGFYAACGFVAAGEAQTLFGPAPTMRRPLG